MEARISGRLNNDLEAACFDSAGYDTYYTRPMPHGWSRPHDAEQLADRRTDIEFTIPLPELPRLAGYLALAEGRAQGTASFVREQGLAVVDLEVEATVPLTCQRCLRPMSWPVASRVRIALVADADAAERVAPQFEAVIAPAGRITVGELVDEELLLDLPIVPLHADPKVCAVQLADERDETTQQPFAGLAELLKRSP